ncbi:hypothetical protein NECAME_12386 [Necator americanus]|uniref:WD domain, G-beta repeat protein n=1 Tax=Necator americanus TaxID=51031 RepID=W2T1I6_NECAM|nr:hypothetical protein NECAME_12386 [Necator americanus]ETN75429.1 hypothetical protein NECAME_12386 [Necator americanus]
MDTAMGHILMLSAARHKKDPRIAVSAGNDGFVHVFDADTGEIQGSVQLQQSDKVRGITWCEVRPDLLAIQYYQHATEFRSIESGDEESTVGRLDVNLVPAWVSAAPVGASFAAGGRMATHYRLWDDVKQAWQYTVELRKNFREGNYELDDEPHSPRKLKIDLDGLTAAIEADPPRTTRDLATEFKCSQP